ncbi:N-acetylmuramoyl-L-alanine amidase [Marininema halotolerans]|uniref:N-acetylmuramoyl-L-alanine amidase n=1 Tax=Marininema halotolerans TaxID=1155944 RepID=UPI00159579F2|nr:N-acetylmuramoyl-L-alanine amidase [Marininema halotolerans]
MNKARMGWMVVALIFVLSIVTPAVFAAKGLPMTMEKKGLNQSFQNAADEYDVPVSLLMAIGYVETHWEQNDGKASQMKGYGIMQLMDDKQGTLRLASRLTGVNQDTLKKDSSENIRGAAAVIDSFAKKSNKPRPQTLGEWYEVVADYAGFKDPSVTRMFADDVYDVLQKGVSQKVHGEELSIHSQTVKPHRGSLAHIETTAGKPDYESAEWEPVADGNFTAANRGSEDIKYIVIHTTQGSYSSAINWFQNPKSKVSAHFVLRSKDGEVTQMVHNRSIAWHARDYNTHSIGIEHEGYVEKSGWYTDKMYRSSAKLTRWLCEKYKIPMDRKHIIAHSEVPGTTHTDPGSKWDWDQYMKLVKE